MARGRHAKKKQLDYRAPALGVAVGLGIAGTATGTASAATMDEWDRVALCESGGQWNRPDGDGGRSSGGLQFQPASWSDALAYLRSKGVDTSAFPGVAYQATKEQQIMAGEALLALQGPRAWSVTWNGGAHCGNAAGGALATGSMFKGGPDPFAGATPVTPPAPKPKPPAVKPGTPAQGKSAGVHTVKRGDWLSKIAKARLGDAKDWPRIYKANRSVIGSNPNLIHPGQKLKIPGAAVTNPVQKPKGTPVPAPPVEAASAVLPVQGRIGDSLIVGSGGSMSRSAGGHSGLDISAAQGTPVYAALPGTVHSTNSSGGAYGLHVVIKHADGLYTLYAHLSAISVSVGESVAAGHEVGRVGSTGNSSGAHLHFEVRTHPTDFRSGIFLNPITWLRSHGVTV